jgi:hypothetical protein
MVPLSAARITDLGEGDFVRAECIACGQAELIPPSSLLHGLPAAALHSGVRFGTQGCAARMRCYCKRGRLVLRLKLYFSEMAVRPHRYLSASRRAVWRVKISTSL